MVKKIQNLEDGIQQSSENTNPGVRLMNKTIERLLKKVIPILLSKPQIMVGYDLVSTEAAYILENKKFPFEWLSEVAWDNFFECCYEDVGITYKEALKLRQYLVYGAKKELEILKTVFPQIE